MAERLAYDIAADLRQQTDLSDATRALLDEAADKLEGLVESLALVEITRDKAQAQLSRADDLDRYVAEQMADPVFAVAVARDGRVQSAELGLQKLRADLDEAADLLRRLVASHASACFLLPLDYCQKHGHSSPCPVPLARQLLERNDQ